MKRLRNLTMTALMSLGSAVPALAVDTTKTYSSGLLVGIFLAFCALIVLVQLMPALMLLVGFVKSLFKSTEKKASQQSSR